MSSFNPQDLSNEQLSLALNNWLRLEMGDWIVCCVILIEISKRLGTTFPKEAYERALSRIAEIKPNIIGREEKYFPADFAVPIAEIKSIFGRVGKDMAVVSFEGNSEKKSFSGTNRYDIPIIDSIERFEEQIDLLLKGVSARFKAAANGRLVTFGSCFAVNVGRHLRERGKSVYTLMLAEDVNSTFNNLQIFKRIFGDERTSISDELEGSGKLNCEQIRAEFKAATGIVFTLGNIFHLEFDGRPTLKHDAGYDVVTETFSQTAQYLREVLTLLKEHTSATILVSVSPVPILGYRGDSFGTAIEADCLSKSQLRAALFECQREFPELVYVPTFEVFRWLPPHETFASFGMEDGISRHIGSGLVKRTIEKLVE